MAEGLHMGGHGRQEPGRIQQTVHWGMACALVGGPAGAVALGMRISGGHVRTAAALCSGGGLGLREGAGLEGAEGDGVLSLSPSDVRCITGTPSIGGGLTVLHKTRPKIPKTLEQWTKDISCCGI